MAKLRVWWVPQIQGKRFEREVPNITTGKSLLDVLGDYDLFQFENSIKPDYSNAGGLEVFVRGKWEEWESPIFGDCINELTLKDCKEEDQNDT